MYQWTPRTHVRAIGAWPIICQPTQGLGKRWATFRHTDAVGNTSSRRLKREQPPKKWQESDVIGSVGRFRHASTDAQTQSVEQQEERYEESTLNVDSDGLTFQGKAGDLNLPLPPFLRPAPSPQDKVRAVQEKVRNDKTRLVQEHAPHPRATPRSAKEKKEKSPFSEAFAHNPYAKALAAPVRQDAFSFVRMPHSCLIAFNFVETAAGEGGGKSGTSLFPVSLAAETISKKKVALGKAPAEDEQIKSNWEKEANSLQPRGGASYVLGQRAAIEFISQQDSKRFKPMTMSRHLLENIDMDRKKSRQIRWPKDMPAMILGYLRASVVKRLRYFLITKKSIDNPGTIQAIPRSAGIRRLDDTMGVMCVLRLKPKTAAQDEDRNEDVDESKGFETMTISDGTEVFNAKEATGDLDATLEVQSQAEETTNDLPTDSDDHQDPENQRNDPRIPRIREKSITYDKRMDWWRSAEGFLRDVGPLPPPEKPSTIYFPTMRYRNRRVAVYNLPHMLGEDAALELIKDTAFADCELATIADKPSTIWLHQALVKLTAYLGEDKASAARV